MKIYVGILILAFCGICAAQTTPEILTAIFMDNTGSMRRLLDKERALARLVLQRTKGQDEVRLFGFETDRTKSFPIASTVAFGEWTTDKAILDKKLNEIEMVIGQTTMFDGLKLIVDQLDARAGTKTAEKRVVVFTDGGDRGSSSKPTDVAKYLKDHSVKVFVVALVEELDRPVGQIPSEYLEAKEVITKFVKNCGGKFVEPKKNQSNEDVISQLFESDSKGSK